MKSKIIILILTTFLLTTCRKYEEGGFYVFTNMFKKVSGNYNFIHYYINGVDSANYYFNNEGLIIHFENIESDNDPYCFLYNTNEYPIGGKWNWNKPKTEIYIRFYDVDKETSNKPFNKGTTVWQVKKLKNDEFIIETTVDKILYRAELKKI